MSWLRFAISAVLALSCLGFAVWLWRKMARVERIPPGRLLFLMIAGGLAAGVSSGVERFVLDFAGLSLQPQVREHLAPALAMMLFCVPLEEAFKVAGVWPFYVRGRLSRGSIAATHALLVAAGFACVETLLLFLVWGNEQWLDVLRATIAIPAHFFFAGLWGYMLGGARRDRYFGIVWLLCVALHGLYDHIVMSRGPAFLVVVVPMQAMMIWGVSALLRAERSPARKTAASSLFEAPSVSSMREVMSKRGRPLMLHWIVLGVFVTVGVTLAFLGGAVFLGHRFGIDFALADEEGVEGIVPIALLAAGLLGAFPFSGYLIARASGATSVLEPAWATGAAIFVVLVLFSVTEPTALVITMAIAPVGLALACVGAWLGLDRG